MIGRRTILGAGASLLAAPALAQPYPNKPLKMVVPYPPGGGTDGLGRITSEFLSQKLGQPRHGHQTAAPMSSREAPFRAGAAATPATRATVSAVAATTAARRG